MQEFQTYIDGGYFLHFSIFSAISRWTPPGEGLHEDLDPMEYPDFVEILEERGYSLLDGVFNRILPKHIDSDLSPTAYPTIFSLECKGKNNWRTKEFPQYKATRKLAKRVCQTGNAYTHLQRLILSEPRFNGNFNLMPIGCDVAEGDDIVATLHKHIQAKKKIVIAVDRDFLQIEGINMFDLFGKEKLVTESFKLNERGYALTSKQYKLLKILIGDPSDNLLKVFPKDGIVRCLNKYISNLDFLKESLASNPTAAEQFKRNLNLTDFERIPQQIQDQIISTYENRKSEYSRSIGSGLDLSKLETVADYSIL